MHGGPTAWAAVHDVPNLVDLQLWIAVLRPKLRRIARASAFESSMMNKRDTAGSKTGLLMYEAAGITGK